MKMSQKDTTLIRVSTKNKVRIESILRYGESIDFAMTLLLVSFAKPKFGSGGAFGNRTVFPLFTESEMADIRNVLLPKEPSNVKPRES